MFVGHVAPTDRTDPTNDAIVKPSTTTAASATTCHVLWAGAGARAWFNAVISGISANFYGMYHCKEVMMPTNIFIILI